MGLIEEYQIVVESRYFDAAWYLKRYKDVRKAGINPLKHYMENGWKEMRNPGPFFSTRYYLFDNPDVFNAGVNPLVHFEQNGKKEGRKNKYEIIKRLQYVDERWYEKTYTDVDYQTIDAIEHYLLFGWKEGKNPSKDFSTKDYFLANPDSSALDMCPLEHYAFHINSAVRSRNHIVAHFWGVYVYQQMPYLVFSCVYQDLCLMRGKEAISSIRIEECGAVQCFEEYILNEFQENVLLFPTEFLTVCTGESFQVKCSESELVEVRTLFIWSCFSNRFLLGNNLFFYIKKNTMEIVTKAGFIWRIIKEGNWTHIHYMFKGLRAKRNNDIILFSEFRNIANDNSWELFKARLRESDNAYFVTSKAKYQQETDERIKAHLLIYNSEEHKDMILKANKICCSWTMSDMMPTEFKHEFYLYPFLNQEWYYCPHGVSYDKNSNFLTPLFLGYPEKVFCSSLLEKEYLEGRCGQEHVEVTGYPRMDKWEDPQDDDILFDFTYRKHYTEKYFEVIRETVKAVRRAYPDRKIYYLFHPAITGEMQRKIKRLINEPSIEFAHASNEEKFNLWFNQAKYLITDYSSVAYDFAYRKDAFSIYYLPEGFTEGHYALKPIFYTHNAGVLTYRLPELIHVLQEMELPQKVQARRTAFFRYIDRNNCRRVLDKIIGD